MRLSSIDFRGAQDRYAVANERFSVALSILAVVTLNLIGWIGVVLVLKRFMG